MKSKLKLAVITVLSVVMAVTFACFVGCTSDAENNRVDPPEKEAKVYSVALLYNDANVDSVLNVDLVLGEIALTAKVTKDEGAEATVTFASSAESVAEISADGKVLLKASGETVIKATVADVSKEIVLVIAGEAQSGNTHSVTVVNGVANKTSATAGSVVTITPSIPEDKEFLEWQFDKAISVVNGNTFVMPEGDVVISAVLVDKLASIAVLSYPEDNRVAYGNELKKEGLEIHAYSMISGEEWEVTDECEFELFADDEYILASYTLGSVKKSAKIPVTLVTEYVVSALAIKESNSSTMNADPAVLDGEYDIFKETGYIAGDGGSNPRFSTQNATYCVSNFMDKSYVKFYFYSEFEVNARVTISAASADYYHSSGDASKTPNCVRESYLAKKFAIRVNDSKETTAINPLAKANAYTGTVETWAVCGHFNDSWLMDMRVIKGWNVIRFDAIESAAPNIEKLTIAFTEKPLTVFVDNVKTAISSGKTLSRRNGVGDEMPTDENIDTLLKGYENKGAIFLDDTNNGEQNLVFREEGEYYSTACMSKNDVAVFYVYSKVNAVANIWINTASSASYTDISGLSAPNGVREVLFKDSFEIKLNGVLKTPLDTAKAKAYRQDIGSWTVCQQFSETMLFTAEVKKGWNAISFKYVGTLAANLGDMTFEYVYNND